MSTAVCGGQVHNRNQKNFSLKRGVRYWEVKNAVLYLAGIIAECPPKRGARLGEV